MKRNGSLSRTLAQIPLSSFWEGFARVLDLGATLTRYPDLQDISNTGFSQDVHALQGDWNAVGADMWKALEDYAQQFNLPQSRRKSSDRP